MKYRATYGIKLGSINNNTSKLKETAAESARYFNCLRQSGGTLVAQEKCQSTIGQSVSVILPMRLLIERDTDWLIISDRRLMQL